MPYQELPHTADWCLRVWGDDMSALFSEAARGMNALAGAQPANHPQVPRTIHPSAPDAETLLVNFLSELVYSAEQEHLTFKDFDFTFERTDGWNLTARMIGLPLVSINKTIKAVTFHNLQIINSGRGFEVEIVFDV